MPTAISQNIQLNKNSKLVHALREKKMLLRAGDDRHRRHKTALIINGGFMWSAYSGGVAIGLEELGMFDVFDYVIGLSSGAASGAYFLAKQSRLGSSIYYEDLVGNKFINFLRFFKILNLDYLEQIFREKKSLKTQNVKRSRSTLLVGITDAETGKGKLVSAKKTDDLVLLLKASMAAPYFYPPAVQIDGKKYIDGGVGVEIPLMYALSELGCNNILVIPNQPNSLIKKTKNKSWERLIQKTTSFALSSKIKNSAQESRRKNERMWEFLNDGKYECGVNILVMCFENINISRFTTKASELQNLVRLGYTDTLKAFGQNDEKADKKFS